MAAMFGIAMSANRKEPAMRVEGHNTHPVWKGEFSGHRFVRKYPDMNQKNTERKAKHRAYVEKLASEGICWTPYGLYRMYH